MLLKCEAMVLLNTEEYLQDEMLLDHTLDEVLETDERPFSPGSAHVNEKTFPSILPLQTSIPSIMQGAICCWHSPFITCVTASQPARTSSSTA